MPREAYDDKRRYEDTKRDRRSYRNGDRDERDERHYSSSSRKYREPSRGDGSQSRDLKRSSREDDPSTSSRSIARRRSSRSPDFERDRAREREAYDRRRNSKSKDREEEEEKKADEVVFEASGLLAKESNNKNGVALKYAEPPEARISKKKWRLYVFKDGKEIGEYLSIVPIVVVK
jgi:smad nuclear-interacting protein 1